MGMTGKAFGEIGSGYENGKEVLCGGGASGASIWVRNVGTDPLSGETPAGFPPPGGMSDDGHGPQKSTGWDMGVPTHWDGAGNGGSR